ncbi:sodium channel protein Nach-like [Anticarsia gemmatalis]|uniref:sodium channel protein Nach-like n=1 Tax=Anticarsia gemmatalis TaxID=129554 RepID=UPI003F75975C
MWAHPPLKLKFDKFLQDADPYFNVTDIMFKFSPPCTSVIERCSWRGRLVPCETLFATRVTPLGFCCVFNSRYYPEDAHNEPYVLDLIGQNYGLGIVVTENRDNFKYVRRNSLGAEMLVFEGSEYPLLQGGDVRLYPLPRNYSMFVNVRAVTQQYNPDVLTFSEEWRGCRTSGWAGGGQSQCLAACWRDTAAALCGCVPFTLHAAADTRRVCSLRDLTCLNKHREKFLYQYPVQSVAPVLRQELQDGLSCTCRVSCRRQLYSAEFSYSKYSFKPRIFRNFLTEGLALINSSTVRMYYNAEHHERYTLEANVRWHEVLAKISTQWILVGGISFVTVVELVYHCTIRFLHHFIRRLNLANNV